MTFFTSPLFVAAFMSSPVWLAIIAILGRNYTQFARVIWSYFWLMIILNLLFIVSPQTFWTAFFPWRALWLFACIIFTTFVSSSDEESESKKTSEFVCAFLTLAGIFYFIGIGIPYVLKFFWVFLQVIWNLILAAFHSIVTLP